MVQISGDYSGFILLCDHNGLIKSVIRDDDDMFHNFGGNHHLSDFIKPDFLDSASRFFSSAVLYGSSFSEELTFSNTTVGHSFFCLAMKTGDHVLLLGADLVQNLGFIVGETFYSDNKPIFFNNLSDHDDNKFAGGDYRIYEDMTRLNNELITMQRQLAESQAMIQKKSDELAQSNRDLDQFAYVISHDLQEPLRMVSRFTGMLAKRYSDSLDQDAKEFIEFILEGSGRMQQMIQDLLAFSRLKTRASPFANVDTGEVVDRALFHLQFKIEETHAKISVDPLPIVYGDENQLLQLFQNLIDNAMKYQPPGNEPNIQISSSQPEDGQWVFSISDNGIGIKPEDADLIFEMFHRLATQHEYPGTGIGLASCKRIVERHGGRIWVESSGETGSVFRFTLPPAENT